MRLLPGNPASRDEKSRRAGVIDLAIGQSFLSAWPSLGQPAALITMSNDNDHGGPVKFDPGQQGEAGRPPCSLDDEDHKTDRYAEIAETEQEQERIVRQHGTMR